MIFYISRYISGKFKMTYYGAAEENIFNRGKTEGIAEGEKRGRIEGVDKTLEKYLEIKKNTPNISDEELVERIREELKL